MPLCHLRRWRSGIKKCLSSTSDQAELVKRFRLVKMRGLIERTINVLKRSAYLWSDSNFLSGHLDHIECRMGSVYRINCVHWQICCHRKGPSQYFHPESHQGISATWNYIADYSSMLLDQNFWSFWCVSIDVYLHRPHEHTIYHNEGAAIYHGGYVLIGNKTY